MKQYLAESEPGSIWRVTGRYRGGGTFTDCLATIISPSLHGTDEVLLAMLPPLDQRGPGGLINPDQIDKATLIVEDPFTGGTRFSAEEVIRIANETSDSLGNLYRIDFINRIKHEANPEETA